jgi:hypothetical protein
MDDLFFTEYLGVVSQALDTTGPMCNKMVSSAHMTVKKMIQTDQGRMQLKKMFKFVYVLYTLMIERHGGLVVTTISRL